MCRCLLLRGDIVQIATVVQIVQTRRWCHAGATRWTVGQVVNHIRRTETAGTASGSIVELLLLRRWLQVGIVGSGSVLVHVVVRMERYVVVVKLLLVQLVLLFVDGVVSGVNVNVSEIAIATVAAAATVCCGVRVGHVSIIALDLLIDRVLLV